MKTVVFGNSSWCTPLITNLFESNQLSGIVLPHTENEDNVQIERYAQDRNISCIRFSAKSISRFTNWMGALEAEVGFCLTFPFKLPSEYLGILPHGIFNFHFGALPANRGPEPMFWILKSGERNVRLTVHKMVEEFDQGPIIHEENVTIFPGENYGLLGARLAVQSGLLREKIHEKLCDNSFIMKEQSSENVHWKARPVSKDLTIRWSSHTAEEIEALVNACNPKYGGAITYFRQTMIRILEVSPADVSNAPLISPGMIVHANSNDGIFVLCSDYRFLKLNLLKTPETYLTGNKLAALGIKQNEKFMDAPIENVLIK